MKKKEYPKKTVYYYSLTQNLEGDELAEKPLSEKYSYIKSRFMSRFLSAVLYRCLATPVAFIHSRLFMRDKIIGKAKMKPYKKTGCFIYGNHTQPVADAFMPNIITFPSRCNIIISRKNLSIPILGSMTSYLGGLPLPDSLRNAARLSEAIKALILKGHNVCIYPEARLWSYCPFLRPFREESFSYPVRLGAPVFCFTRVYKRARHGVRSEIYIDGPFFAEDGMVVAEKQRLLAEKVAAAMQDRLSLSDVEVIRYVKRDAVFSSESTV